MGPRRYRIVVKGRVSERFASVFHGVRVESRQGETALVGELDQAQLRGVLDRMSDFGLELLRVEEATR